MFLSPEFYKFPRYDMTTWTRFGIGVIIYNVGSQRKASAFGVLQQLMQNI